MKRYFAALSAACLLFPLSGLAGEVNVMPSIHYDYIATKLIMGGYKDVRVMDSASGKMSAYDPEGSEVIIQVEELSRTVLSTTKVHRADE
ncbi:hypothetical protein [Aestuariicoccus sp. MJ-SS9]|uniref:hypothetical protein n=1 Tax=Aestuariicoccus sp. MJ-SS9 TaxID=3079855 RepID=UPI002908A066|nr:hypothetical protein [Aestuariicoccus sp. MJ-SS9]MDU8914094.1 hypothetical protein [Aestuariicoccus sp. MJ-SS9]